MEKYGRIVRRLWRQDILPFLYKDDGGGVWKERAKFDGFNTALSGNSFVEHTPVTFAEVNGREQYVSMGVKSTCMILNTRGRSKVWGVF